MVVDCQRAVARLSAGLLALLVVVGAGCDDPPPPEEPNRPPIPFGIIPDDTVIVDESKRLNVKDFFKDPDSLDILVYTAESSDESRVAVEMEGAVLTYTGVAAPGDSRITITATDPEDESAEQKFEVTVLHPNRPPECGFFPVTFPIGVTVEEDLEVICYDPDNDEITSYAVERSDPDIVSARLVDKTLIYETVSVGTATITVTMTDTEGNTGEADLVVTVVEEEGR